MAHEGEERLVVIAEHSRHVTDPGPARRPNARYARPCGGSTASPYTISSSRRRVRCRVPPAARWRVTPAGATTCPVAGRPARRRTWPGPVRRSERCPRPAPGRGTTGRTGRDPPLLRQLVAAACGKAVEEIEADRPLVDYGLSSRDAVGISGELGEALGRDVPATLLWEHPTIDELVSPPRRGRTRTDSAGGRTPPDVGDPSRWSVSGAGCPAASGDRTRSGTSCSPRATRWVRFRKRWRDCGEDAAAEATSLGSPAGGPFSTMSTDSTRTSSASPPVKPRSWTLSNGCCSRSPARRSIMPDTRVLPRCRAAPLVSSSVSARSSTVI